MNNKNIHGRRQVRCEWELSTEGIGGETLVLFSAQVQPEYCHWDVDDHDATVNGTRVDFEAVLRDAGLTQEDLDANLVDVYLDTVPDYGEHPEEAYC